MPLSKKRNKERMKISRATCVQPTASIPGLIMEGNKIVGLTSRLHEADVQPIPLYNPAIHKAGDRVMMKSPYSNKLIETTIPEVDGSGNAIYEY